jgi:Pectate lyase superfamily protein
MVLRMKALFAVLHWAAALASACVATVCLQPPAFSAPDTSTTSAFPRVFSTTSEARPGDVIWIQGAHLDASLRVMMNDSTGRPIQLPIVRRVGDIWIAVQLPQLLPEPTIFWLHNDSGESEQLRVNVALPYNLDTTEIVPGGAFRVFGRNLKVPGHSPSVVVNDQAAAIDLTASNDSMLVVTAPAELSSAGDARIMVDNGNGTGAVQLDRKIRIGQGSGDPLSIGVGWGAGFTFTQRVMRANAACDGKTDDTERINQAVNAAAKAGGAVVQLPEGTCRISGIIKMASRVVLRGLGRDRTVLRYEQNFPIYADGLDLIALQDLQLSNPGPTQEGVVWRSNTRSVIQRVTINMGVSRQWFLTDNTNFIFDDNIISQTGSYDQQNPYRFDRCSGLVFSRVHSTNVAGSPTFQRVHDSVFLNNQFTRDASSQKEKVVVAHHGFVMDFAYRIALIDNTFDVVNGPVTEKLRNDGETLLVENGGPFRHGSIGTIAEATADGLTDPEATVKLDPFGDGIPENYGIAIVAGVGAGQVRRLVSRVGSTLTIDHPWEVIPTSGSKYSTFVWGLDKVIIKDNHLIGNPRGIWLYGSSIRDVAVVGNEIADGGGIFLRSYQNSLLKIRTVQFNVLLADNRLRNESGEWMSHIILAEVISDPEAVGMGQWGIEVRRNRIVAHVPNVSSSEEDYASQEGFVSLVHFEAEHAKLNAIPNVVGPIFQDNTCERCVHPFSVGPRIFGAILVNNTAPPINPGPPDDIRTSGETTGGVRRPPVEPVRSSSRLNGLGERPHARPHTAWKAGRQCVHRKPDRRVPNRVSTRRDQ